MKLRLSPLLSLLIAVSLLAQGAPLPAAALTEPAPAEPAVPTAFSCNNVTQIPKAECEALVALYNSANGANWFFGNEWLQTLKPCDSAGITCSQGHVQRLGLSNCNLQGSIPPQLGNLTNLTNLDLSLNDLTGVIPRQLENLTHLQYLSLMWNGLTGTIPPELGNLANLQALVLSSNGLTGVIPPQLGHLTNLRGLDLSGNELIGAIPAQLEGLANLTRLDLSYNDLSGTIPSYLGNLANLTSLWLAGDGLTGAIPQELGNLTNLIGLGLGENCLTGAIPPQLGNLANLTGLWLHSNQLTGTIPPQLGNLAKLRYLWLNNNRLTGSIPLQLANLAGLEELHLNSNRLTGTIPPRLGALANLQRLWLSSNQLTDVIPSQLGNLTKLQWLYLENNQLTGVIPPELGNLTKLTSFAVANNAMEGEIPSGLVSLTNLNTSQYDRTDFGFNKLVATNPTVIAFLAAKDPDWARTQTVPPTHLSTTPRGVNSLDLACAPISYTADGGYYEVGYSTTPGGPYSIHGRTANKSASSYVLNNLGPAKTYYLALRTYTPAHGYYQKNNLLSGWSQEISATTLSPTVSHIEISQATQTITNSVPLIAGKPTFVRVYLDCGEGCSSMPGVTGVLEVSGSAGGAPLNLISQPVTAYHPTSWTYQRGFLDHTLNFTIPDQLMVAGEVSFTARAGSSSLTEQLPVHAAKTLRVAYIPVKYEAPSGSSCPGSGEPTDRIKTAFAWARRVYPTARIDIDMLPAMPFGESLCASEANDTTTDRLFNALLDWFHKSSFQSTYVFGWLPDAAYDGGVARVHSDETGKVTGGQVAFGDDDVVCGQRIFAHEISHLLGRPHTKTGTPRSCENPSPENWSDWPREYGNAGIQEWGFDPLSAEVVPPGSAVDYTSYCWYWNPPASTAWTSSWTYQHVFSETLKLADASLAIAETVALQPSFIAGGLVYTNNTATIDPIWVITPTAAPINPPVGTTYCLEAQNSAGTALAGRCFDLTFVNYETGQPTNVDGFNLMLPYPPGMARIVLKKGATELAVRSVSAHAPVVDVLSPSGGETWAATGTYTITWTASDLDGDPLTYSVLYSPDGNSWVPVGTAITTTLLAVNAAELAGGNAARVRVLATDGVNTSSDESDAAFTVGRKAPSAFILAPEGGVRTIPGTPLWLPGYGYDLEDGTLEGVALRWRSDRDGDLGAGSQALVTLSPGRHVITLAATDKDGNQASASISVYAGGKTCLPLVLRGQ